MWYLILSILYICLRSYFVGFQSYSKEYDDAAFFLKSSDTFKNENGTFSVKNRDEMLLQVFCFKKNIVDTRTFQDDLRSPFMVLPTYYLVRSHFT